MAAIKPAIAAMAAIKPAVAAMAAPTVRACPVVRTSLRDAGSRHALSAALRRFGHVSDPASIQGLR